MLYTLSVNCDLLEAANSRGRLQKLMQVTGRLDNVTRGTPGIDVQGLGSTEPGGMSDSEANNCKVFDNLWVFTSSLGIEVCLTESNPYSNSFSLSP
ncbi:hypothetical protein CCUS01_17377 [Colletotrichum cuscutae]|uniref:Uncharacterized protein n=1 Tax=Colletotrichum cuscutae TaxID=1209917 RepID=A0AAI9V5Q3_9PEZI|nr:hypothetical protein CCUS01_17377 [Colletotrichum cuscutae]